MPDPISPARVAATGQTMQCPMYLGLKADGSDMWLLPLEPIVTVRARKKIVERDIAKQGDGGTVKEIWAMGDYQVEVVGLFVGDTDANGKVRDTPVYPQDLIDKLDRLLSAPQSIYVRSALTDAVGIGMICPTDWEFPATPGLTNQQYGFHALSDHLFNLF